MLTLFRPPNTVVWLPSSFNPSIAIAMLLLVASCVERSLLVQTVRDYSAYNFDSQEFQARVLIIDENKSCHFHLIAHWPVFIQKVGVTRARLGHMPGPESIHTSTTLTTRGQTRISSGLIPHPHGVEIPTPPADFLISHGMLSQLYLGRT